MVWLSMLADILRTEMNVWAAMPNIQYTKLEELHL